MLHIRYECIHENTFKFFKNLHILLVIPTAQNKNVVEQDINYGKTKQRQLKKIVLSAAIHVRFINYLFNGKVLLVPIFRWNIKQKILTIMVKLHNKFWKIIPISPTKKQSEMHVLLRLNAFKIIP